MSGLNARLEGAYLIKRKDQRYLRQVHASGAVFWGGRSHARVYDYETALAMVQPLKEQVGEAVYLEAK